MSHIDAEQAWKGIFQDSDWMFKTGIGGMLNAGALLLLALNPLFAPIAFALSALVTGYMLRVIRYKVLNRESKLPDWDNWLELLISGLTWLAVQFGLWLILISAISVLLLFGGASGNLYAAGPGFVSWGILSTILVSLLWTVISFMTGYLMVNFAIEERVPAGFAVRKVISRAKGNFKNFSIAWLLGVGLAWAAIVVPVLTVIGIFIVPSTMFLAQLTAVTIAAQVWGKD